MSEPIHQSLLDTDLACSSNVDTNTHFIQTNPAHNSRKRTDVEHTTQTDKNNIKPRWYAVFVHINNIWYNPKKLLPIGINNYFPSISLILGILEDEKRKIRILVNTGAAMNTGNLHFHMWVMSQFPDIVDEFLQCGKDTTYDVVHLLAALNLKNVDTDATSG